MTKNITRPSRWQSLLLVAELSLLTLLVVVGFIYHDGQNNILRSRFFANLIPLLAPWLLFGSLLRIYATDTLTKVTHLWRPLLCALASVAVMLWARALWLDASAILLPFANAFSALLLTATLAWRTLLLIAIKLWQKYRTPKP